MSLSAFARSRLTPPRRQTRRVRALVNPGFRADAVPPPTSEARAFHESLPGYRPTPLRTLPFGRAAVKDESDRLGLPAFKVLGASWAIERALREQPSVHTLVAASAGNHGRAVARVAAMRGLACRVYLPVRSLPARREAIAGEGAEVVVVDGAYEETVAEARLAGTQEGWLEVADVGESRTALWVIDGYATLFAEVAEQGAADLVLVPVGVGSLAAAAASWGASVGVPVIGVEPVTAACLTASLAAGKPTAVATPGSTMAGLDCAEVSIGAWPFLRDGIRGTITVSDDEAAAAMRELASFGFEVGESGAAPLAALHALHDDAECAAVRAAVGLDAKTRVVLIATEGLTGEPTVHR
jgi:diaminopropionate ammonia-lyase